MVEAPTGKLPDVHLTPDKIQSLEKEYQLDILRALVLGGRAYLDLLRRGRKDRLGLSEGFFKNLNEDTTFGELPKKAKDYALEGLRFAEWMVRSDRVVNSYVDLLYTRTASGKAIKEAMEDPKKVDHGFPHIRRDEEWFEAALLRDGEIRHGGLPFKYWLPAAYLAIRNHDVIQQLTGEKRYHPELAAVFTLATYKQVAKAFGVDHQQAFAYCQFAAMMILGHSSEKNSVLTNRPDNSPTISPKELIAVLGENFGGLMPKVIVKEFNKEFKWLSQDDRSLDQSFAVGTDSHLVFKKYNTLLSWADKADTHYPARLTALRSLLVPEGRHRVFYEPPTQLEGGMEMPLEEELVAMMNKDRWQRSFVGRKLYELQRDFPVTDNPFTVRIARGNKLAAIKEVGKLYTHLMAGDQSAIDEIFEERANSIKTKVVSRGGIAPNKAIGLPLPKIEAKFRKQKQKKYEGVLNALEIEKQELMGVIKDKMGNNTVNEINRVKALFDLLYQQEVFRQGKPSGSNGEPPEEWVPYKHFDTIADLTDPRKGKLVSRKLLR